MPQARAGQRAVRLPHRLTPHQAREALKRVAAGEPLREIAVRSQGLVRGRWRLHAYSIQAAAFQMAVQRYDPPTGLSADRLHQQAAGSPDQRHDRRREVARSRHQDRAESHQWADRNALRRRGRAQTLQRANPSRYCPDDHRLQFHHGRHRRDHHAGRGGEIAKAEAAMPTNISFLMRSFLRIRRPPGQTPGAAIASSRQCRGVSLSGILDNRD